MTDGDVIPSECEESYSLIKQGKIPRYARNDSDALL